ncbi:hypothetical protein QE250_03810 [Chromatiaceae bacterium AAb-1]|nr:hypothetical protein [Chromatiaceae bacterium AAb-1]
MKRSLCYLLLILMALPAWSVHFSVPAFPVAEATHHQHQLPAEPEHPCHSQSAATESPAVDNTGHDCCNGDQNHHCDNNCTTQHCSAGAALLMATATNHNAFLRDMLQYSQNLPKWLFFDEPPPPVNA